MIPLLRSVRLLSLVSWVGGLVFFAFILAPTAFHVLPSTHEAGLVVAATLYKLHEIGLVCFFVFVPATAWLSTGAARASLRLYFAQVVLISLMAFATMYLQWSIIPTMERDRIAAGGNVDAAPPDNPARLDFERLHPVSEKVEGTVLLLGLAVVILIAVERPSA